MPQQDKFLHTTHRTVAWFNKAYQREELELSPPFQRNPVWTHLQKSYLIDTILQCLPIPEIYMQDLVDQQGGEKHIVVDGQQRIRAVLDFLQGEYELTGDDVAAAWRGRHFEDLGTDEKQNIFSYKFVVRILPSMIEEELRAIFSRLNRNVVSLNDQELRNATYWGQFIKTIQKMADDPFWSEIGVFSANDHRRMLDHEFISELAIAFLHWPQNKKDKLDHYYQLYEESFEDREGLMADFAVTASELRAVLPNLPTTRWRKKSDFYTLFLGMADRATEFPLSREEREALGEKLRNFAQEVDELLRLEVDAWDADVDPYVATYAQNVARAASDRGSRVARMEALNTAVFGEVFDE